MKSTLKNLERILAAHNALDNKFDLSGKAIYTLARNIRILRQEVLPFEESAQKLVKEPGERPSPDKPDELKIWTAGLKEVNAKIEEMQNAESGEIDLHRFTLAGLKIDPDESKPSQNKFPVKDGLAVLVEFDLLEEMK